MEEAGGGEANIRARLKFQRIEDCANAHRILGITKHHSGKRIIQRTWRGMCHIMLRLEGKVPNVDNIRNYQADYLGRSDGSSLLCELMPIPKPSLNHWGYEALIPQFESPEMYYQMVMPRRMNYLRELLTEHRPQIVIGYGRRYWQEYQDLFEKAAFSRHGRFMVAQHQGTRVILTDHFTARTMNGKLDEVVALANKGSS